MNRRQFLDMASKSVVAAATINLIGCRGNTDLPDIVVDMPTSWAERWNTDAGETMLFSGAKQFAQEVANLTEGKLRINPLPVNSKGIRFDEVLTAVQSGTAQIGYSASYYSMSRSTATAFSSVPFGLVASQQNEWLYDRGGLALMQDYYADQFNAIQFPAGNTGAQAGGWFSQPIDNIDSIRQLNMRIPGLGGLVMRKLGATVVLLPGSAIHDTLKNQTINSAEFVGPHDDYEMKLHETIDPANGGTAYFPGFWEPSLTIESVCNLDWFNGLPEAYQTAIETAAKTTNDWMLAEYNRKNSEALTRIRAASFEPQPFPKDVMDAARDASLILYDELSREDADFARIYEHWNAFRQEAHTRTISYENASAYEQLNEAYYMDYVTGKLTEGGE